MRRRRREQETRRRSSEEQEENNTVTMDKEPAAHAWKSNQNNKPGKMEQE